MALTQVGSGMLASSQALLTPTVATTMGVGNATPAASGAGITFPATQSQSSDANTLDDYEEGTWTPVQAGVSLTVASATYTKIGRMVHYTFDITWPATADATAILLTGLVHTPGVNAGIFAPGFTTYTANRFTGVVSTAGINLYHTGNTPLTNANLTGARIIGSGSYFSAT